MAPAQFYAATLREVDAVIEGERWRRQQNYLSLRYGAWHSALYQRIEARQFPTIFKVMGWKPPAQRAQTVEEQTALLLAWKADCEAKAAARQSQAQG